MGRCSFQIYCDVRALQTEVERGLLEHGLTVCPMASWHIVLDAPVGWAFVKLTALDPAYTLVVSNNPCPEYRLDLLNEAPGVLLSQVGIERIAEVVRKAQLGEAFQPPSVPVSRLTPKERFTLRLIAEGHPLEMCAKRRNVSEGTLRNTLQAIYLILGLDSRVQLAHYYYGNWALLRHYHDWQLPFTSPRE